MPYYPWFNGTGLIDLFSYANTVTQDVFWVSMIFILGVIIFSRFKYSNVDSVEAFVATSFILIPVTIFTTILGLTTEYVSLIPIVLTIVTLIVLYANRRGA